MDIAIAVLWFICTVQAVVLAFAISKIVQSNERIEMIKKSEDLNEYTQALDNVTAIENPPSVIDKTVKTIMEKNKAKKAEELREKSIFEERGGESNPNLEYL